MTRIVSLRTDPYDVYIGRPNPRRGLSGSPWANPFVVGKDGTRAEVLEKYRKYLADHPDLIARARRELRGKVLGCWCKPLSCHGDVLVEILDSKRLIAEDTDAKTT